MRKKEILKFVKELNIETESLEKVLKVIPVPNGFGYSAPSQFMTKNIEHVIIKIIPKSYYIQRPIPGSIEINVHRGGSRVVAELYNLHNESTIVYEIINGIVVVDNSANCERNMMQAYMLSTEFASVNKLHGISNTNTKEKLKEAIKIIGNDIYGNKSDKFKIEMTSNSEIGMIHHTSHWGDIKFDPMNYPIIMNNERVVIDVSEKELLDSINQDAYINMKTDCGNNVSKIEMTLMTLNECNKPILHFVEISNEYAQSIEDVVGSGSLNNPRLAKFYLPKLKELCKEVESSL